MLTSSLCINQRQSDQNCKSCKVADSVSSHEAWGLGIDSVFIQPNVVVLSRAIEVPGSLESGSLT
jgi:hypothetical protein